jgi:calcium-binding protein CML
MNKRTQYERVFNHFDDNGDGKISPSELQQCVESIGGEISAAEAEAVVELVDSDGDGLLGMEDFVRFLEGGEEEEKVNDLKEACNTPSPLRLGLSLFFFSNKIFAKIHKVYQST